MITRKPRKGDVLEYLQIGGGWTPWGTVSLVEGNLVWTQEQDAPFIWCFGRDGCLGNNVCFRIVADGAEHPETREEAFARQRSKAPVTMADPFFN